MKKNILILVFSNLKKDARVARQVDFLKSQYAVTVACYDADPNGFMFVPLKQVKLSLFRKLITSMLLITHSFRQALQLLYPYIEAKAAVGKKNFDLIIANDVETLMLAFDVALPGSKVIFDAHEYAPRHFEDKLIWRLFFQPMNIHLCKKYISKTAAMMTIGKGLAHEYEKHFNVKPIVITNANHFYRVTPSKSTDSLIRLVHHGIATPSRRLELMIEMMDHLDDRFTLDLYLLSSGFSAAKTINYPLKLQALAAHNTRIRILPPMKSEEIVSTINQYDMGIFLIPPVNFNYANTLPNKFFDFIQARLAIAVGPTPEMAEIVNQYKIGVVSEDFSPKSLAKKIIQLTADDINSFKLNTEKAALELNAESSKEKINNLVKTVLDS